MAAIRFTVTVKGGEPLELPVTFPEGSDFELIGLGSVRIHFIVSNPPQFTGTTVLPNLSIVKEGSAKDKVSVSLLSDSMTISGGGGSVSNTIIVEANKAFGPGDEVSITISGETA